MSAEFNLETFELIESDLTSSELAPIQVVSLQDIRVNSPCKLCALASTCSKYDASSTACVIATRATEAIQAHIASAEHLLALDTPGIRQLAGLYASLCIAEEALAGQGAFTAGYYTDMKTKEVKQIVGFNNLHKQYRDLQKQFLVQLHEFGLTPLGRVSTKTRKASQAQLTPLAVYIQNNYAIKDQNSLKVIDAPKR